MALGTVHTSKSCKACGGQPLSFYYQSGLGYVCGTCFFGPGKAPAEMPIEPLVQLG